MTQLERFINFFKCILVAFFIFSCAKDKNNETNIIEKSKNKTDIEKLDDSVIDKPIKEIDDNTKIILDTLINDYRLKINKIETNSKIILKKEHYNDKNQFYNDINYKILIENNDKTLIYRLLDKGFFTSIIPKEELKFYQFSVFNFEKYESEKFVFFINMCQPDSDICYTMQMFIDRNGKIEIIELDDMLESDE